MLGPLMNPYAKNTTTEESKGMWAGLGPMKPTFQYARHFPAFVPGKLKNNVKKVNKYMKNTKKRVNAKVSVLKPVLKRLLIVLERVHYIFNFQSVNCS